MSAPPSSPSASAAPASARWRILAVVSLAELLGMSLWFTASAVSPRLRVLWDLGPEAAGWLTTVVQLGFVAGTGVVALLNLADVLPSRTLFATSALLAAGANGLLLVASGFGSALVVRFATGFFLAGVYPPAMKMIATWFRSARGMAIGTLVGALTVGKASPWLLTALGGADLRPVVWGASLGAILGAALVAALYRDGPHRFERRPFSWGLTGTVLRHRPTRLAIGGYLGHMWELYAMWAALGGYFLVYFSRRGLPPGEAEIVAAVSTFAAIGVGGLGAVVAGVWADRFGREDVASGAMILSGSCALALGWLLHASPWVVLPVSLVWGFTIVADSAQFSALVTEVTPKHAVGTALTIQTSLGFALTGASIWLTFALAERVGWGPAFAVLALGPVFGVAAMACLKRVREKAPAGTDR